jgi:hypothetical protein
VKRQVTGKPSGPFRETIPETAGDVLEVGLRDFGLSTTPRQFDQYQHTEGLQGHTSSQWKGARIWNQSVIAESSHGHEVRTVRR